MVNNIEKVLERGERIEVNIYLYKSFFLILNIYDIMKYI